MDTSGAASRPPGGRDDRFTGQAGSGNQSLGETVTGIIEDLQNIVRGEVQLAKTELKEDASQMGKALGMIGAAALLGLTGFIFLMLGVTYLINTSLEMWLSAGIVGLALAIIAALVGITGKNQLQQASFKPEQTIASVKEDKEWASRQIKSVKR
jgi:uncharacterized membrane protein YqjE